MNKARTRALPNIRSLGIEGRLWFDKANGNTYHAVSISANGKWLMNVGITYGYEDHYLQTALEWLKKWQLVSDETTHLYQLQDTIDIYTARNYTLKRELFKDTMKGKKVEDYYHQLVRIEALKNGEF